MLDECPGRGVASPRAVKINAHGRQSGERFSVRFGDEDRWVRYGEGAGKQHEIPAVQPQPGNDPDSVVSTYTVQPSGVLVIQTVSAEDCGGVGTTTTIGHYSPNGWRAVAERKRS